MVGVQLLDKRMRSAALEVTDGASSNDATVALPRPQPQLLRPHRIDASASQVLWRDSLPEVACIIQASYAALFDSV